jgi:LacI family transcriptional regulator
VSVVAHDDELPGLNSAWMPVPLTVTRSPLQESWGPLADILAGAIKGVPLADLQRFWLVSFIERASVSTPSKPL